MVSRQLPPEENCSPVRLGVWAKVRVSFRVGGPTRQLSPRKIVPELGLAVVLGLILGLRGNFPRRQLS